MGNVKVRVNQEPEVREDAEEELVTCFVSGRQVPRSQAVQVRIGPRQRVWMLPEYTRDWEPSQERR